MSKEKGPQGPRKGPTKARHEPQLRVVPAKAKRGVTKGSYKPGHSRPGPGRGRSSKNPVDEIERMVKSTIRDLRRLKGGKKDPMEPGRANSVFMGLKILLDILDRHGVAKMVEELTAEVERLQAIVGNYPSQAS